MSSNVSLHAVLQKWYVKPRYREENVLNSGANVSPQTGSVTWLSHADTPPR